MAMLIPLGLAILPYIPKMIDTIKGIVDAIRSDPQTPEAAKAQLDAISTSLDETAAAVAAVRFRDV
jgi:hypothetical protein